MIRQLQKIGNSKGILLTRTMIEHLGIDQTVEITMEDGRIILSAPRVATPRRQSFEEARNATFAQYDDALQRLD